MFDRSHSFCTVSLLLIRDSANIWGIDIDVANAIVGCIVTAHKKNWNVDISTVASFNDLPSDIKHDITKSYGEDAEQDAKGIIHKGKVYVIADNNESVADIEHVLDALYLAIGGRKGLIKLRMIEGLPQALCITRNLLEKMQFLTMLFPFAIEM